MLDTVDFSGRSFHFIGIGGIGMSALASILAHRQLPVSGSDLSQSHITQRLQAQGIRLFWQQDATNFQDMMVLPQVVCSTAIQASNLEYQAAIERGCPILHRSDLLAALIQQYQGIAVAGTHGKTTTSSMIGYLLYHAELDPTIVVGGEVDAWQGNARLGHGPHLVAEADESDGSLVKLATQIGVITNIELDHPDHYTSLDQVVEIFQTFAQQCQTVIGCIDSETLRDRLTPTISYSLNPQTSADYTADQIQYQADGTTARIWERGHVLGQIKIQLLGQHNLSNALAAIAVGRLVGLEFSAIASALATFEGARRRFEIRATHHQITFVDDYAHHPSEIRATLEAARLRANSEQGLQRVVAVFQPHRYSRAFTFLAEFAASFADADLVVSTDIYSAGETNSGQVAGQQVATAIASHHSHSFYQPTLQDVEAFLQETLQPGDLVLFLGAGNLNHIIPGLADFYRIMEQRQQAYVGSV
jgi:UDP-N-acetylmuramate--alanine ligase